MKHNSIASAIESVLEHILQVRLAIHLLSKPTDGSLGEISNFRQWIYNTVSAINLPIDDTPDHHHDAIDVVPGAPKGYFIYVSHFHLTQLSLFALQSPPMDALLLYPHVQLCYYYYRHNTKTVKFRSG